ncbi:unnamed protein product [Pieris macdunnoughi]|uniref:Phorbol-ester/DAG-type domain-containing protein n=1 Tax=Pieris macdunnoughi TaxID=345717 RepID=A0A821UZW1_9NEOP|nr:unnamed protein product [Pieris macdunnoughi]
MYHAVSTVMAMRRNGASRDAMRGVDSEAHNFQEYTYKKITPCDVCSQVLRGHTRQGLRCRICKMNVHTDCMPQVGKCQTKSRLLRRQKSTSEIEAHRIQDPGYEEERCLPGQRLAKMCFKRTVEFDDGYDGYYEEEEVDLTYQVLKRANEIAKPGGPVVRVSAPEEPPPSRSPARPSTGLAVAPQQISSSSGLAPHPGSFASQLRVGRRLSPGVTRQQSTGSFIKTLRPLVFSSVDCLHAFTCRAQGGRGAFYSHLLSEIEETTTRPFGQPLCITNENGDPPPSILKPTASVRKKK